MRIVLLLLVAVSLSVPVARADDTAYADILKERDAVLSQIVTEREAAAQSGAVDARAVMEARLALLSFRRETASSTAEKIAQQKQIVGLHEKALAVSKQRQELGVVVREELLLATDAWLQAKQLLEELKRAEKAQ